MSDQTAGEFGTMLEVAASEDRTDNDAIIETAQAAAEPTPLAVGEVYSLVVPAGGRAVLVDTEQFQAAPNRKRGTVELFTAGSFADYVKTHDTGSVSIFADVRQALVEAVIDGDTRDAAGWGQHRAVMRLRFTDPWKHWTSADGRLAKQQAFAEHIEQGLLEIVDPAAADMLEIAQHFQANTAAEFQTSKLLSNGQVQLKYTEQVDARAGVAGQLDVPATFTLALRPFEGSDTYKVTARLRYRVGGGALAIGYQLDRPNDVLNAAFDDVLNEIAETTSLLPYAGLAPKRP